MLKRLVFLTLAILLAGFAPIAAEAAVLKIATIAPEGSQWMQEMRKGADEIKTRTAGRVTVKFYGGGVMGNEKSVLRKIRIGQLHGGAFTGGGLIEVYPDISLYSLPMVFRSLDELDYVRSRMDKTLEQGLEGAGFVSFGFAEGGFALIMANKPVRSLDDLRGKKIWVPEGDSNTYAIMEGLGLSPVTLPITDVLTGLQTGLIDIIGTSPIGAIAFQWHTKVQYISTAPLAYLFATLVVDRKVFDKLSVEDQAVVREVMEGIYRQLDTQNRRDNEKASVALGTQGLEFVEFNPGEVEKMRSNVTETVLALGSKGAFSLPLYQEMRRLIEAYHSQPRSGAGGVRP
ncbi:TRAP-type C4-dicarboxylate transport system, periplasmic component [Desulfuromonas soudanensis]|uniref:TRAP-type C4-dicarboxylate transport system, periplasmic component n=1 Tax=Desulfuromonas soudanensis TaxID=1603606 RepID=A0A0M4D9F4_9BACT|nr:TRAP transporter substrate-binding protein DctP [Desulfuromonas soudanensis]ALC16567.1 TRAP-type C4-dicarboxylate transport system, periplasmic component [Desulfuromonas soudanensis]